MFNFIVGARVLVKIIISTASSWCQTKMTNGLLSLASRVAANIWNEEVCVIHVVLGVFSLANA